MVHLLDTSVLGRLANTADPQFMVADLAIAGLHHRGETLRITAQNLVEFRNFATRPKMANGLGLTSAQAEAKADIFEASFSLLPDNADIYPAWKTLVSALGVIGKQVHDARLVAVCHVHGISHLLTFNTGHFIPLAAWGPGIMNVDPASV